MQLADGLLKQGKELSQSEHFQAFTVTPKNRFIMDMQNAFQSLNWLAIAVAAVSAFALGGLWYSPVMFAKR